MKKRIIVVMPAFNAAKTLEMTCAELPHEKIDSVILVDDGSSDETLKIARDLNLIVFVHSHNFGYGAHQKTCWTVPVAYIPGLKTSSVSTKHWLIN